MEEIFNPYREWLDWDQSRAPDYYELLAIDRQESDVSRMALAAEQAIVKVRSFRPGPQACAWSRLLDEIRAAKECLSNPRLRADYDRMLARSDLFPSSAGGLQASVIPAPLPPADWAAGPSPTYDPRLGAVTTPIDTTPSTSAARARRHLGVRRTRSRWLSRRAGAGQCSYHDEPASNLESLLPPGSDDATRNRRQMGR